MTDPDETIFEDLSASFDALGSASPEEPPEQSVLMFERFRGDDDLALGKLLERYYPRVRRIVRIRMGPKLGRYYQDEDFIQETFLAALRGIDRFEMRDRSSLFSWLATITEHQLLRALRKGEAIKNDWDRNVSGIGGRNDSGCSPTQKAPARHRGPSSQAGQREFEEVIDQCLLELPDDEREVILLRHFQELPWEQVRTELDRPTVAAVQQLKARALRRLGGILLRRRDDLPSGFSWV